MKQIQFDYCSEMVEYLGELLEEKDNVSIYCDYNIAVELLEYVYPEDFEEFNIEDLDESCDEYYFGKVKNSYCGIQKARMDNGELLYCENDYVVILDYIVDDEELDKFYGDVEACLVDFYEYDLEFENNEDLEENNCDCIECILDFYRDRILEVAPCPECTREVLAEFLCCVIDHVVVED
jgi:hypothetical protein